MNKDKETLLKEKLDFITDLNQNISKRVKACLLDLRGHQQKQMLSSIIIDYLLASGEFYNTDNGYFYFIKDTKQLIRVSYEGKKASCTQEFANFLNTEPRLNSTVPAFEYVFQDVVQEISRLDQIKVHRNFYYNKREFILYIYNNNGEVLKVTPTNKEIVNNGVDNIFFVDSEASEYIDLEKVINAKKSNLLDTLLIDKINFESTSYLTNEEQKKLFKLWVVSILFETIQPTKPLIVFQGEAGSGKTDSLKAVGKIFFGSSFSEKPIQKDIRDFYSSIVNNYYYQIDNLDTNKPDWFEDIIASITTGSSLEMRALYKNVNDAPVLIVPKIFVSISTMNARFTRQDIASRTLLFTVKKLQKYDNSFIPSILENRHALIAELVRYAQAVIKTLKKNKATKTDTELRLADFAGLIIKTKDIFNIEDSVIEKINSTQNEFALQNDLLVDIIATTLDKDSLALTGKKTAEIYKILKTTSEQVIGSQFPFKSPKSLGVQLKQKEKNLKQFFMIRESMMMGYKKIDIQPKVFEIDEF